MNRLANETSPYLLLHKDNPVDWRPWGPEALAEAEATNKPILLSIGYTACHWCMVMEQESFRDPQIAAFMNEHFINIKVDREERPDVDLLYQASANLMGHNGGWPLTMFLTPQRVPYAAGSYFPAEERPGQQLPSFQAVLRQAQSTYSDNFSAVITTADNVLRELTNLWHRDMRAPLDQTTLDVAAVRTGQRFDIFFGGIIGQQTKFPSVPLIDVLWRAYLRTGTPQFIQLATTAMDNMLLGGLWDHVGGGFSRYCMDERWLMPNWEKTLPDNALLLEMMVSIWQFNRNKLCESRVAETIDFLLRDMKNGDAFASCLDSNSEGEPGKYYLWTEAEIDAALVGTFAAKFKAAYGVTREGNFEGKNVLRRLATPAPFPQSDADEALLVKQRSMLLAVRQKRVPPRRDDKVLADWNGLAIAAIANAGGAFQRNDWTTAAIAAFEFIVAKLGDGDRLYHSWIDGRRSNVGFAEDYANMIRAALTLYEIVGDRRYVDYARRWTRTLNEHFWDIDRGGYFMTPHEADPMIVRPKTIADQPLPCANATMISNLTKFVMLTAENQFADKINELINNFSGEAQRVYTSCGTYFAGLDCALSALHLIVIGPSNSLKTHELTNAVLGRPLPNRFLSVVPPEYAFPENHPMFGKTMLNGQPTAYICQRGQVSQPVTNPVTLSQMLQLPVQRPPGAQRPQ